MSAPATVAAPSFASLSFDEKLDRLAEVAVRVGLGLRAGQELLLTAPVEAMPLVRRITEHAYRAGALLVTTFYADDPAVLARFQYAPDASFDYAPVWLQDAIAKAFGYKPGAAQRTGSGEGSAR
jgi:aminopeptidase